MYPIGLARQAKENKRSVLLQASCLERQSTNSYLHVTGGEVPSIVFFFFSLE